jgi:hypothetical protein
MAYGRTRDSENLTLEVTDLEGLRFAVGEWLTDNWSDLKDGAWGDVTRLVQQIAPHVHISQCADA